MSFHRNNHACESELKFKSSILKYGVESVVLSGGINADPTDPCCALQFRNNKTTVYNANGRSFITGERSSNALSGIGQGTISMSRIGNSINVKKLFYRVVLTANGVDGRYLQKNGGEMVSTPIVRDIETGEICDCGYSYMRTTYRVCIVKDKEMFKEPKNLKWDDVFENNFGPGTNEPGGIWGEKKIDVWAKYDILRDITVELNGENPQKTIEIVIHEEEIGEVRYKNENALAPTSQGIYLVWSNVSMGYCTDEPYFFCTAPIGMHRLYWED